jgi:hypothetical protein
MLCIYKNKNKQTKRFRRKWMEIDDGDTVSDKLCFTIEANTEAETISKSVKNFVSPDGKLLRVLGKEAHLTFYNMTRQEPPGGVLSDEQKKELLSIKRENLNISSIAKLFGNTTSLDTKNKKGVFTVNEPKFNPRAKFTLNANEYINKEPVNTSVGIFLLNKLLVEGLLETVVPNGYYNEICNKKKFSKLTDMVASGLMSGTINVEDHVVPFLTAYEFWGLGLVTIFSPSYSMETIIPNKELEVKKKAMLANAKDGDLATLVEIEDVLIKEADKLTKGSAGKYLFDSGARGSFDNDFKNMAISVGPVSNPITNQYDFMTSNYMEGIKKEDLPAAANIVVAAEYPKAIGTAKGGYLTKQFYAVFQSIVVDEDGTDCGTKEGLEVIITPETLRYYVDQYLMDGNKLILINEDLDKKYMYHKVKVRSTMYCLTEKLCSKCAGARFYKVGIDNLGLTTPALSGSLLNAGMKSRHNMKVRMNNINEDELLI